jgi:hypothetical protein
MKRFWITKEFIEPEELNGVGYELVVIDNIDLLNNHINDVTKLIDYFNTQYKWDGMFKIHDVEQRIINNGNLFLLYYNKQPIGYTWFKEIDNNIGFIYNVYVTKIIERPKNASKWFMNKILHYNLKKYSKIKWEIEDWNWSAINLFLSLGTQEIKFI